ncbi:M48 family metalloprotease [Clostridium sp. LBM24168]
MLFWLYGILIEIFIILLWYHGILKQEIKSKNILLRGLKVCSDNIKLIIKSKFNLIIYDDSNEIKKIKSRIKKTFDKLVFQVIILFGNFLILPLIIVVMINDKENYMIKCVVGIALIYIFVKKLLIYTKEAIKTINESEQIINFFEESLDEYDKHIIKEKSFSWNKGKSFVFVIILAMALLLGYFIVQLIKWTGKNNSFISVISLIFFIIFLFMNLKGRIYKKRRYENSEQKIEIYDRNLYLMRWDNELRNMCSTLGIKDISFYVEESEEINAYAYVEKNKRPKITILTGFLLYLGKYYNENILFDEIFKFTIGHELIHIYYKDPINVNNQVLLGNLIYISIYIVMFIIIYLCNISRWMIIPAVILFFIEVFFGRIITDKRYWMQMNELRADRKGIAVSNSSIETFKIFWKKSGKIKKEKNEFERINNTNYVYQFYKRYIENEAHPSAIRRIHALNRYPKWNIVDYIQQVIVIRMWQLKGRGWNGR